MRRPSASNVESFVRCGASHLLPQHDSYQEKTERGSDGHALLADFVNKVPGSLKRMELAIPGLGSAIEEHISNIEAITAEEAYVVDVKAKTSKLLGINIGRKYEEALGRKLKPYEICTSLDVHGRKGETLRWIRDFKFGVYHSWWQLWIQAMAVMWSMRDSAGEQAAAVVDAGFLFVDSFSSEEVSITQDSRLIYLHEADAQAGVLMDAFGRADAMQHAMKKGLHYSDLQVTEGKWCQYCGAFPHCPAKWRLAKSMLSMDMIGNIEELSLEQCGEAWLKLSEVKKNVIEKMEATLKTRMRVEGGFPLKDEPKKMLKMCPMPGRTSIDREGAIHMLRDRGASDDEIRGLVKRGESYETVRKVNR